MALNLVTLTSVEGDKVEVNPAHVIRIRTVGEDNLRATQITFTDGKELNFADPQAKIRERFNARAPDGFG